jgi:hypothetical protein
VKQNTGVRLHGQFSQETVHKTLVFFRKGENAVKVLSFVSFATSWSTPIASRATIVGFCMTFLGQSIRNIRSIQYQPGDLASVYIADRHTRTIEPDLKVDFNSV